MLKKLIVVLAVLSSTILLAQEDLKRYSAKVYYGYADDSDFGEILTFQGKKSSLDTTIAGFDMGYMFAHKAFGLPIDFYLKGGYSRYFENGYQDDLNELNALVKLYYNIDFYDNRVRVGLGEGGSYVWGVPTIELSEAMEDSTTNPKNSKYLNYIDVSIDFDIGRLIDVESMKDTYIGYSLKHRSGIFGLINGVRKGGSNYNTLYLEMNF
ncbi:MAG: hypothetical protein U9N42_05210 [Campylobacterota bacterium]|nr:hypothetical protein [Campylobacterota bacterium]